MGPASTSPPQPTLLGARPAHHQTSSLPGLDLHSQAGDPMPRLSDPQPASQPTEREPGAAPLLPLVTGGPGGSHALEDGGQARLRTLARPSGAAPSSHSLPTCQWRVGAQGGR